jgi:hypothetical protein
MYAIQRGASVVRAWAILATAASCLLLVPAGQTRADDTSTLIPELFSAIDEVSGLMSQAQQTGDNRGMRELDKTLYNLVNDLDQMLFGQGQNSKGGNGNGSMSQGLGQMGGSQNSGSGQSSSGSSGQSGSSTDDGHHHHHHHDSGLLSGLKGLLSELSGKQGSSFGRGMKQASTTIINNFNGPVNITINNGKNSSGSSSSGSSSGTSSSGTSSKGTTSTTAAKTASAAAGASGSASAGTGHTAHSGSKGTLKTGSADAAHSSSAKTANTKTTGAGTAKAASSKSAPAALAAKHPGGAGQSVGMGHTGTANASKGAQHIGHVGSSLGAGHGRPAWHPAMGGQMGHGMQTSHFAGASVGRGAIRK